MLSVEKQPVAAQWRAQGCRYSRHIQPLIAYETALLDDIYFVLVCAGVVGDLTEVRNKVQTNFAKAAQNLVEQELRIHQAIVQDILSCDFNPVFAHCGDLYSSSWMEHDDVDQKGSAKDTVFCTMHLGLGQSIKKEAGGFTETALVKARVLLISEFQELLKAVK